MGNNASVQSTIEDTNPVVPSNHPIEDVNKSNGWDNVTNESTHLGWGSSSGSNVINDQGWMDKSVEARDNGWGERTTQPKDKSGKFSSSKPTPPEVSSSGWADEPTKEEFKGWLSKPAETEFNGWINEPEKDEYNGWAVPPSMPTNIPMENTQMEDVIQPLHNPPLVPLAPSAPPLPEDVVDEAKGYYPFVDSSRVDLAVPSKVSEGSTIKTDAGEENSSLCIICWEGPVEGACVPCGHMAGCMPCLHEIKSKKGDCPVCRGKIDQIIRLYAV